MAETKETAETTHTSASKATTATKRTRKTGTTTKRAARAKKPAAPKHTTGSRTLTARLDGATYDRVLAVCKALAESSDDIAQIPASRVIVRALDDYLPKIEKKLGL